MAVLVPACHGTTALSRWVVVAAAVAVAAARVLVCSLSKPAHADDRSLESMKSGEGACLGWVAGQ